MSLYSQDWAEAVFAAIMRKEERQAVKAAKIKRVATLSRKELRRQYDRARYQRMKAKNAGQVPR